MRTKRTNQRRGIWGRLLLVIVLASGLLASACGNSNDAKPTSAGGQPIDTVEPTVSLTSPEPDATPTAAAVIGGEQERVDPPELSDERTAAFVNGLNTFGFDLYRFVVGQDNGNLVYSPTSIELAFSMVYAGARSETEAQMAEVLGFLPQADQHPAANTLDAHLSSLGASGPAPGPEEGEPFRLTLANAVWGQEGYPFLDAFLQTLAEHYGAGLRNVDFIANTETARLLINAWVAERTEGRIQEAVPPGVLNTDTRLVLANAIYFKAGWLFPFQESATANGPFTLLDGNTVTVPLMRDPAVRMPFGEGDGYQFAMVPYTGQKVEMVIILPEEGRFSEMEEGLSAEFLAQIRASRETHDVALTMPRFDFETQIDLAEILPEMGMPDPFRPEEANFNGIADGSGLFIDAAIHHATIAVDEKGTEATAATIIAMAESGMPMAELTLDRPFIFAIVDSETGAVIFLGRVMNPAG